MDTNDFDTIVFKNLDSTASLASLQGRPKVQLARVLDPDRIAAFQVANAGLTFNYAAKQVDEPILASLAELAVEQQLIEKYEMILSGVSMNTGENRKVLHHLARGNVLGRPVVDGTTDIGAFYAEQADKVRRFAAGIRQGSITSGNGRPFTAVVQIGIGGSDLGPRALYLALAAEQAAPGPRAGGAVVGTLIPAYFISNVDPDDAAMTLAALDPATTLFIVVSKSGTTQETLTNEAFALHALEQAGVTDPKKQVVAVTSATSPLAASGDYLESFFIDDFIGGRYSATSPVGTLVLSIAYGPAVADEILAGAHAGDVAALTPDIMANAPLLDALIGVYERNVLGYSTTAVLPYSQALHRFPAHLQQLDMESNGKRVNRCGRPVDYATGPVVFGEPGTNGQHSFYQLLHQGTDVVPLQFIGFAACQHGVDITWSGSTSQAKLNANLVAQIVAFAVGKTDANANKHFPGERPSSLLYAPKLTPRVLGALLAHYENKVMFQGLCWNVNSFDQEGVQLGKVLATAVLNGTAGAELGAYRALLG